MAGRSDPLTSYKKRAKATLRKIMAYRRLDDREAEEIRSRLDKAIDSIRYTRDIMKLREELEKTSLTEGEIALLMPTLAEFRRIRRHIMGTMKRGRT